MEIKNKKIAVIGLGYVGLPLAVEFGKNGFDIVGFDINQPRIDELNAGTDSTLEVTSEELKEASGLSYTSNLEDIKDAQIYIVTVPTPIDKYKTPDLTPLKKASETVGKVLSKGDIVIYESTVYPGCTEEECVPVLEKVSGMTFNEDFYAGYSPERINPGDHVHRVHNIMKVTSGSTPEIADEVDALYASIVTVGTHKASCIKVAEAAKVIENSQRDLNIAFVNELSKIFDKIGIDTIDVLEAAGTKWNFLPFRPGLVGGHCIGVDPYYLTYKAESLGYHPEVILAGRRINDSMGSHVASEVVKKMLHNGHTVKNSKALILGITFKENCPDIRNSKVIDVIRELQDYGLTVDVYDPNADKEEVMEEYGIELIDSVKGPYESVVAAVAHDQFQDMNWSSFTNSNTVVYDVKHTLPRDIVTSRL
ncbi:MULTISPECIES: Vi polysaccharide biosynthesis UDP-N-acetylglucosamine C-6 dehydrogenase TviB [Flammeovirga]|uniref:Vi polysaccharide biosynthesis UDP-N-acetylglucosamine C-6 dehydrogenase TviB n=1 Tax=Flammeovirga agarivorans TaxID=2726742 RepID=A0A7X8SPD2_9BACT|nr:MULTISPECIES: Vi polysaccharide biosynthesis UDP-N-acetylglucosamine C-6 dehydrogenase TviB [Flammeovirga]NLR93943.1 Vi polysaccharide biosynthesis UDP-N-acetylglucosamine C-6 dehydrogenase TviB [Flammeovirga agarivorans]